MEIEVKILPGDYLHVDTDDGTCSRCRKVIPEDHVPLRLWKKSNPNHMWSYCEDCCGSVIEGMEVYGDKS